MENLYKNVADIIQKYDNIVFFGGAGVSTECGIPDFRSEDGLYSKDYKYSYKPETILSHSFFENNPDVFYEFLFDKMMCYDVVPNKGHKALTELEKAGKLKAIITQNIDGLHQASGSNNVIELHGTLSEFSCTKCRKEIKSDELKSGSVPLCSCGGILRPSIVLYEENLDEAVISKAINYISKADVLIIAGTSLSVYPAAGLINYFKGEKIIIINKSATDYDRMADIIIHKPFAITMMKVMLEMGLWKFNSNIYEFDFESSIIHPTFRGVRLYPVLTEDKALGIRSNFVLISPGGEIMPHTHDVVEVFTVISGEPYILIDNDWIKVNTGTTMVAYPGEIHGVRNSSKGDVILQANFNIPNSN